MNLVMFLLSVILYINTIYMQTHFTKQLTKKFYAVILAIFFLFTPVQPANAIVCGNCSTWLTDLASIATTANVANDFLQNWVLGPIADAMRLIQMTKSGNFIRNLVLGSMGTNDALLITNPKQYLTNQGKASIRESLKNVEDAKGVYSDAISGDEIRAARMKYDSKAQLTAISHSDRPAVVQKSLCSDDDLVKLTELAGNDDPQDSVTYRTRREELYDKLCTGDPAEDPELSKALLALDSQDPSVGGWKSLLTATQEGGSAVAKMRASVVIATNEQAKVAAKAADLAMGNGVSSQTECGTGNKDLQEDGAGNTFCPDGKETIIKNSSQLDQSLKAAIGSPLKLLSDSYGSKGIFALIGSIASLIGTVNTTMNAFQAVTTSGTPPTTTTTNGVTTTTYSTSTYSHTLTPGSGLSKQLTDAAKQQTDKHLEDLGKLGGVNGSYLAAINKYGATLTQGKTCYESLITNFPAETINNTYFPPLSNDTQVQSGLAFFSTELNKNNTLKNTISSELNAVQVTRTLVTETITKITSSDSVEEIQDLLSNYTIRVEKEKLPGVTASLSRTSESMRYDDTVALMTEPGGQVTTTAAQCTTIGQNEAARRAGARSVN